MIGQTNLLNQITKLINEDNFPHFVILVGAKGSGKKLMATQISKLMNTHHSDMDYVYAYTVEDVKIDSIRNMIKQAYKSIPDAVYIIPDADEMSANAKNALLKVTEEPPNNAYVIMTLEDINNTLPTIKSRATIFTMENYTPEQIYDYAKGYSHRNEDIVKAICETPGEVDILYKYAVIEFYEYVEKVIDNIATVSGANCFKIADKIALKDEPDKYDIKLFWKAFCNKCLEKAVNQQEETSRYYTEGALLTSKYIADLRIKSVNKQMLFDHWVLNIRRLWM